MGINDRDYVRNDPRGGDPGLFAHAPMTKVLVLANIVVFVLQIVAVRDMSSDEIRQQMTFPMVDLMERDGDGRIIVRAPTQKEIDAQTRMMERFARSAAHGGFLRVHFVEDWLALDTNDVVRHGQVWRLVTYGFCHDTSSLWHIAFNMLALYSFGALIESMLGGREYLLFYFIAIVVSGLAFVGLDLAIGRHGAAIGASGAVMAVVMLFTWHHPRVPLYVFGVLPVEARYLMAIFVAWDLYPVMQQLTGSRVGSGIAHAAHLGGALFGFLYGRFHWRFSGLLESALFWRSGAARRTASSRPRLRIVPETTPDPDPEPDEVDVILKKILDAGRGSLTDEERDVLRRASDRLKRRQPE